VWTGEPPGWLTAVGDRLFFVTGVVPSQLWRTDGTVLGTLPLVAFPAQNQLDHIPPGPPEQLTAVGDILFFTVDDGNGYGLWKSDGTVSGTVRLVNFQTLLGFNFSPGPLIAVGDTLFFTVPLGDGRRELWRSDGTADGTQRIPGFTGYTTGALANVGGTLFFANSDVDRGVAELWRSDGTEPGTRKVTDILPDAVSPAVPTSLFPAEGGLFFFLYDPRASQTELWFSDGTEAGTLLVHPIASSAGGGFITVGRTLYFADADTATAGAELWRSDGTSSGTVLVKDIRPGPVSSNPFYVTDVGGTPFFIADDGSSGPEIWKTDGTDAGTVRVTDVFHDTAGSFPSVLTDLNGTLLFASSGNLWRSDGTATGTHLVKSISTGAPGGKVPRDTAIPIAIDDFLYFAAGDGRNGVELWRSDGTEAGTTLVKNIDSSAEGSYPFALTEFAGVLFFWADAGDGFELWRSNGTADGTVPVSPINPEQSCCYSFCLDAEPVEANHTLFLPASDGNSGYELWKTDGTAAGTVLVADIAPGSDSSFPLHLTDVDGTLFFTVGEIGSWGSEQGGPELWKSDGTEAGTVRLARTAASGLTNVNGALIFFDGAGKLWRSDGSEAGTAPYRDLGAQFTVASGPASLGDRLVFAGWESEGPVRLWRSDGTADGTAAVIDLPQGRPLSPAFTNIQGILLFVVGSEIWQSDGTATGTHPIQDFRTMYAPNSFTLSGGDIFFAAEGEGTGPELWALPLEALATPPTVGASPTPPAPTSTARPPATATFTPAPDLPTLSPTTGPVTVVPTPTAIRGDSSPTATGTKGSTPAATIASGSSGGGGCSVAAERRRADRSSAGGGTSALALVGAGWLALKRRRQRARVPDARPVS